VHRANRAARRYFQRAPEAPSDYNHIRYYSLDGQPSLPTPGKTHTQILQKVLE